MESVGINMDNYDELIFEENDYIMHKLGGYPDFFVILFLTLKTKFAYTRL